MRLAATLPFPAFSLAALSVASIALIASSAPPPVAPMAIDANIVSAVESVVLYREQVRAHREPMTHRRSVWRGTYVCAQGETGMTLTIDVARDGAAVARYDFGPIEANPTVPTGAFLLAGKVHWQADGGLTGELDATKWIARPDEYFMVPLSLKSKDGRRLVGKSHHETCLEFTITRVE